MALFPPAPSGASSFDAQTKLNSRTGKSSILRRIKIDFRLENLIKDDDKEQFLSGGSKNFRLYSLSSRLSQP